MPSKESKHHRSGGTEDDEKIQKKVGVLRVLLLPATKCILRPLQCVLVPEFSSKYDSARGSLRVITVTVTSIIFGSSSC
jgi:hypothetical protein